jgi:hypothetical protein
LVRKLKEASTADKVKKTAKFYSKFLLFQWHNLIWPFVRYRSKRPVFIVGCSRSGTTVVYKVLSMAMELASLQKETHDFWNSLHPPEENGWDSHRLNAAEVCERDRVCVARYFFKHVGMKRFVDKSNQNCFRIPYLLELFPDACFVYVKRDGRDNINSLIHGWGRPDEYAIWSQNLPAEVRIENGTYQRWSFFLFPGWRDFVESKIEDVCAQQWISANQAVLTSKAIVPQRQWVEIFYEDILKSPVAAFRKVYNELSLTFDKKTEGNCESLTSNPYNAFSTPRLEKWKEENPERIRNILPLIRETMLNMDYKV